MSNLDRPAWILWRGSLGEESEEQIARKYFRVRDSRVLAQFGDLVIGRYSVLPFYKELEDDLSHCCATLINTHKQHQFVADIANWEPVLRGLTPKTWHSVAEIPDEGPFVLKGATNSRKFHWDTEMFARNRREASEVAYRLSCDTMIGQQNICVRQYVPLRTHMLGLRGLPITHEFRVFVAFGEVLSTGYYWSSHAEELREAGVDLSPSCIPQNFLQTVIDKIGNQCCFYTVDVAQTQDGSWIVIELNDGQMSGLSENDPEILYRELARVVDRSATYKT